MGVINRDRGVVIKFHPSGFRVFMYKDSPGQWLDEKGNGVNETVAGQAGFAVTDLVREKEKQARMEAARRQIEADYADKEAEIEALAGADPEGLNVKMLSKGKWAIYDGEQRLTKNDMTKAEATQLFKDMTAK